MVSTPIETPTVADDLAPGLVLGRHRIHGPLSHGGMATLYFGEHVETGARVAIKVLHRACADDNELSARFDREARLMGRLSGVPQIAQVHDVGRLDDGRRYLVSEFIRGTDLEGLLGELRSNDEPIDLARACRIMRDVALGLEAAHRRQVVHRDLKPANIMLSDHQAGNEAAKLVDFGVSADLGIDGRRQELTSVGAAIGTAQYMAPEQAAGAAPSPSVDIYAFGTIFYEALSGRPIPREGWRRGPFARLRSIRSDVPTSLDDLVARCTSHDATQRPQSAAAIADELSEILDELGGRVIQLEAWAKARPSGQVGEIAVTETSDAERQVQRPKERERPAASRWSQGKAGGVASHKGRLGRTATLVVIGLIAMVAGLAAAWFFAGRSAQPHDPTDDSQRQPARLGSSSTDRGLPSSPTSAAASLAPALAPSSGTPIEDPSDPPRSGTGQPAEPATPRTSSAGNSRVRERSGRSNAEVPRATASDRPATRLPATDPQSTGSDVPADRPSVGELRPPSGAAAPGSILDRDRPECRATRSEAVRAKRSAKWEAVLAATEQAVCWPSADELRRLRVEAFLELHRFSACVAEGRASNDHEILKMVRFCRTKASP